MPDLRLSHLLRYYKADSFSSLLSLCEKEMKNTMAVFFVC